MGGELGEGQRSWLDGFNMPSPSWFPLRKDRHPGRFRLLGREAAAAAGGRRAGGPWQNLFRGLVKGGRGARGSQPPLTFHYDIASYYKNFDDGSSRTGASPPGGGGGGGGAATASHPSTQN